MNIEYCFCFGLVCELNGGWKGFQRWFGHISPLVSSSVTIIANSLGNSTANIHRCSNLGKVLFVHFLRLLHAFQTNVRQMIKTCWQSLACKQEQFHSGRQRTNVGFQLETRTVTCQGWWWDEQLITTIWLVHTCKLPVQGAEAVHCQTWLRDICRRWWGRQFPKWRFYLFKSIKREKQPRGGQK